MAAVTGLPTRRLLEDRIEVALARTKRDGTLLALLFIDLDKFKDINDGHGHGTGDEVLVETARRLVEHVRPADTVARIGGDEFVILAEGFADLEQAQTTAASLQGQIASDVTVNGARSRVCCLRLTPRCTTPSSRAAPGITSTIRRVLAGAWSARSSPWISGGAIEDHQLWIAYQPLVAVADAGPVGLEALARWSHPERGPVSPGVFIPLAEESGFIVELGKQVLNDACAQVGRWNEARSHVGLEPLYASVNCSVRQLLHASFLDTVANAVRVEGMSADLLTLEITESVLVDGVAGSVSRLEELAARGIALSLDDFGTGYSSWSYLRRLPVGLIKIDRGHRGVGRDARCGSWPPRFRGRHQDR